MPFFPHDPSVSEVEKLVKERKLHIAMEGASSAIGDIISLGQQLLSERVQERMIRKTIPLVARNLKGLPCRVVKAYSLLLTTVRLVRNIFYYLDSLFKCMYICSSVKEPKLFLIVNLRHFSKTSGSHDIENS